MEETLQLTAGREAPAAARHFVSGCLRRWGLDHSVADAELLTSELVTNAVRHAGPPVVVHVRQATDGVVVAVHDPDPVLPALRIALPADTSGRGLAIVAALATDWGVEPVSEHGKAVWFRLGT